MIVSFTTLGCKTNQFETAALQTLLRERGHRMAEASDVADAVVINTCAVTLESSRKSRQAVRRAREAHPGAVVAVCGCLSQLGPEEIRALQADLIYGSGDRLSFVADLERAASGLAGRTVVDEARARTDFEVLPAGGMDGRSRALLKVQDGCDNFCTYCIIPYARGSVRSLPLATAVEQAKALALAGYGELVVTGIEISSYGRDFADGTDVVDLIAALCRAVPRLRIRLGSLEPRTVTEAFCERLSGFANLCGHFHLSLQSGSDETLLRMGRRYTTEQYAESLRLLRRYFSNVSVATDLIVGFPGECAEAFERSVAFMRASAFSAVHVFPYSERAGTPAAEMSGQVSKPERRRRAQVARVVSEELASAFRSLQIGQVMPVLFETETDGQSAGHTLNYCVVSVSCRGLQGQVRTVRIMGVLGEVLLGELV